MSIYTGPGGLEEVYAFYEPSNTNHLVDINNLTTRTHAKLTRISGLKSRPDWEDNRIDHVGRRGQTIFPSYPRSRTITFEGTLRAKTLDELNQMGLDYREAFDTDQELVVRIESGWFFRARITAWDPADEQVNGPNAVYRWQRSFILTMVQSDPRIYWYIPVVSTGNANNAGPVLNNAGRTDTDAIFTVHGVGAVVTFQNFDIPGATSGHARLRFNNLPGNGSTSTLTVDFLHRRAVMGDGTDVTAKLSSATDWWDDGKVCLKKGDNHVQVTAEAGSTWDYIYFHAIP